MTATHCAGAPASRSWPSTSIRLSVPVREHRHLPNQRHPTLPWWAVPAHHGQYGKVVRQIAFYHYILNIFKEGELKEEESVRKIGISDFSTKPTNYYNLDVIISVGYRVKSIRGTQFRQWATKRLNEYIRKGYTMMVSVTGSAILDAQEASQGGSILKD